MKKLAVLGGLLALLIGCDDLADFRGSYSGVVVGSDDPDCTPPDAACSFIRRGFPEATVLTLTDFVPPPEMPSGGSGQGTITTAGYGAFLNDGLQAIAPLENDQLSLYDFPGADRVRNFIFSVQPVAGLLAGRDVMVFVSLIDRDRLEMRVIAGPGNVEEGDHFGLFRLERQ